ncbi:MAG: serine/threonine-protein kinase [Planctomycetota bacterium]
MTTEAKAESKLVGDYEVLEMLGSGAAGSAYRARRVDGGHDVALKLVHARHATHEEIQKRFVREVAVLERLSHPNIVAYRDCGVCEAGLYFAMELVEEGSLAAVLQKRSKLPWREATEVAAQVCDALTHAHAAGIIHRDLKPENLFLSADGLVKVGDFGLARDTGNSRLTLQGHTVGTVLCMAPEQVSGEDELTGAVDLYAVGCLLYQMIVGRPPFLGETAVEVMEKHLTAEPPELAKAAPRVPASLSELVARLLCKEPVERGLSAAHLRNELHAVAAEASGRGVIRAIASDHDANLTDRLKTADHAASPNVPTLVIAAGVALVVGFIALLLTLG